jgi:hypothetical protein
MEVWNHDSLINPVEVAAAGIRNLVDNWFLQELNLTLL